MVFSSFQAYLDQSNWHQQNNHQIIGSNSANHLLPPPPPPPPQSSGPHPPPPHGCPGGSSIRPGSMVERARIANIPLPEPALKCPRCESTNTKFCYFNNYSLSQPRHFCKTCRRYWTRGGALRSVPVGGGCRRNKRSKSSSSSKSSASGDHRQTSNTTTDNNNNDNYNNLSSINNPSINSGSTAADLLGLGQQFTPLRFMSPLSQLTANFSSDNHVGLTNYNGITAPAADVKFTDGSNFLGGGGSIFSSDGCSNFEPWRLQQAQQYPFPGGLDQSPAGNYQFQGAFSGSMLSQISSVKMEDHPELNWSRQLLGNMPRNQMWNSNTANWTDLSSFSSSSTSIPL